MLSSSAISVIVTEPSDKDPKLKVPETSTLPFMSIVVAAICISVSATKSNCPSVEELIYIAVSLNCIFSVVLNSRSSEN